MWSDKYSPETKLKSGGAMAALGGREPRSTRCFFLETSVAGQGFIRATPYWSFEVLA
jgi:hypothetical protein